MRSIQSALTLATITLLAPACNREPSPPPPASSARPTAPPGRARSGPAELALAPIGGTSAIDRQIAQLQARAELQLDDADRWILLGRAFVQKARQSGDPGFYLNADACAALALERKPEYPLATSLRGLVLMSSHRFRAARDLADATLTRDPEDLMALGVLGDALLELGEVEAAEAAVERMMSLKPNLPSYARAAHLRWLRGDVEGAKKAYRLAIDAGLGQKDREPTAWAIGEAATLFANLGDYEGALAGYDRALQIYADYPPALLGRARVLTALGRFDEAARSAKRAFEESATAEAAWVLGDAERAAGRTTAAAEAYARLESAGRFDPHTLAAFWATEGKNAEEAVRLIERELEARAGLYSRDVYAWALHRAGRHADAKREIERATRLGTPDALLLYHAGAIAIANGDVDRGLASVERALSLSPRFQPTGAREAAELLREHRARRASRN